MRILNKSQKGFTLLELLIVIVIIGILAIIIIPGLASGPQRARDAQRKSDLRSIKNALETYYNDNTEYPTALSALAPDYVDPVPTDPENNASYTYTTTGTPPDGYWLTATLENDNDGDINSGTDGYTVESVN